MRTIEVNLYKFDELDEEAQENAINYVKENWHDLYGWHDENQDSLKTFVKWIMNNNNPRIDWEVSSWGYSYVTIPEFYIHGDMLHDNYYEDDYDGEIEYSSRELSGTLLKTYLQDIFDEKSLSGNCPFTGYGMDEDLLDPIREYLKNPTQITLHELIDECTGNWIKSYINDWEYTYSDECISEMLIINDYEFLDNGEMA